MRDIVETVVCPRCWATGHSSEAKFCSHCGTPIVVCETCGNKRCPHATHHDLACTGSNEPGQPGSRYPPEGRAPWESRVTAFPSDMDGRSATG
jgi:hypothetical protein